MARPRSIPTYRCHKQSGQAIVTLTDANGRRRDVLLGKYGTAASRQEYARILAEWEAAGQCLPAQDAQAPDLTMNELLLAYWRHAEQYFGFRIDTERGDDARARSSGERAGVVERPARRRPARRHHRQLRQRRSNQVKKGSGSRC